MPKKVGPYIGVTGFMSRTEVEEALAMIPKGSRHRLMVGALVSNRTLLGQSNRWPRRYPKIDVAPDIFVDDPRALNLVHYNTKDPLTLVDQLVAITERFGHTLDGFQLNIPWPDVFQLSEYREEYPEKLLVLQIGNEVMMRVETYGRLAMEYFADRIASYVPVIDAILIDPSGGEGKALVASEVAKYLRAVCKYPTLGLGAAGGLGPNRFHLVKPLVAEFPSLSTDMQGQVRTPMPEDALNLDAVRWGLEQAYAMYREVART